MRVTQTIRIEQIDHGKRLPLNKKALMFALEMLLRKAIFPPVSVERKGKGKYVLRGGRHRLAAHKLLGREEIRANVAIKEDPNPFKPLAVGKDKPVKQPRSKQLELLTSSPE
jgi:hypothetical protein